MTRIPVDQIYFGDRDGLHEYMKQDRAGVSILSNSFVDPPRIKMSELRNGSRFFIVGPKGSGKTTLLWHLKRSDQNTQSKVILFKSQIRKEDRDQIDKLVDTIIVSDQRKFRQEADYKTVWEWFILKNIVKIIDKNKIIEGRDIYNDICILLNVDKNKFNEVHDSFYIERAKGDVRLKLDLGALKTDLHAEIVARRKDGETYNLLEIVRLIQSAISKIKMNIHFSGKLFFDELEFFMSDDGDGQRDQRMVRDLLFAIYSSNQIFHEAGLNIVVYGSVRTEIINSANVTNQELKKHVDAFGVKLDWYTDDIENHKVLDILANKIKYSEIEYMGNFSGNPISEYFPKTIGDKAFRKYILDMGMHRPRGVLLRVLAASEKAESQDHFTEKDFRDSIDIFGQYMLDEITEEMSSHFDEAGRVALISVFRGKKHIFDISELDYRIGETGRSSKTLREIKSNMGTENIARYFFRIGLIGNIFETDREIHNQAWSFRGTPDPDLRANFVLHQSVRKILNAH